MVGKVKFFNTRKGFGFVNADGKDYFFHWSAIKMDGYKKLKTDETVSFDLSNNDKGECAVNLQVV